MGLTIDRQPTTERPPQVSSPRQDTKDESPLNASSLSSSSQTARHETRRALVERAAVNTTTPLTTKIEEQPGIVEVTTYMVKKGDTASAIARSVASTRNSPEKQLAIMREVNGHDLETLHIGQKIFVPTKEPPTLGRHRVAEQEDLASIAKLFNTTVGLLRAINQTTDNLPLRVGDDLRVPLDKPQSLLSENGRPSSSKQNPTLPMNPQDVEYFVANLNSDFGGLCRSFESKGRLDAYSNAAADRGGASWGCYQIARPTMPTFLTYLKQLDTRPDASTETKQVATKAYEALRSHRPDSKEFKQEWGHLAQTDPRDFRTLQHNFILETHLIPVLKEAHKLGFDITPQTAEVFLSIGVQHGGFRRILMNAASSLDIRTASTEEQIEALYGSRRAYVKELRDTKVEELSESKNMSSADKKSMTTKVDRLWTSVLNRYDQEEKLAKSLVKNQNE